MSYKVTVFVAGTTTPFETFSAQDFEIDKGLYVFELPDGSGSLYPINYYHVKMTEEV